MLARADCRNGAAKADTSLPYSMPELWAKYGITVYGRTPRPSCARTGPISSGSGGWSHRQEGSPVIKAFGDGKITGAGLTGHEPDPGTKLSMSFLRSSALFGA